MSKIQMFLRQFDPFLLPSIIVGTIKNNDGSGTWPFFVEATEEWPKSKIVALLRQYGIESWGWGASVKYEWHFSVKRSQAHWAEYTLLQAGVPVRGRLLTDGAASAGKRTARKQDSFMEPNASQYASEFGQTDTLQGENDHPESTPGPVDLATNSVNRLADWLSG